MKIQVSLINESGNEETAVIVHDKEKTLKIQMVIAVNNKKLPSSVLLDIDGDDTISFG